MTKVGMKWGVILLCLVANLLAANVAAMQRLKVVMLVREQRNDKGEVIPIKDDIRQLFLFFEREAGLDLELRYYPMVRLMANLKNAEGLAFGLSKTTERQAYLDFSDPIYANYVWVVARQDAVFPFSTMLDLRGKTVGIMRGVSYGDEFDQAKNTLFYVEEDTVSHVARLKKLAIKRMDAMLIGARQPDPREVERMLKEMQYNDKSHTLDVSETKFTVLNQALRIDELHFAAATAKHQEALKRLNLAIARGKKTGEIATILNSIR
ncbi:MAG: transporter substrate-binding domain-containing protein [Undibacterium sp.]|nr:transporter substrate-binding domain-containing protein [Undibacterium sp.]